MKTKWEVYDWDSYRYRRYAYEKKRNLLIPVSAALYKRVRPTLKEQLINCCTYSEKVRTVLFVEKR